MGRTILDFETRSQADLKKVGAYLYSLHPSTRVTCMAFKRKSGPDTRTKLLRFEEFDTHWLDLTTDLRRSWLDCAEDEIAAHNAFFERCIYQNVLVRRLGWPTIEDSQWRCTAAKAAACALPRALGNAGEALKLTTQKDKGGMIAMMRTCRPSREWNDWNKKKGEPALEPEMFISPTSHPEVFEELYRYCVVDVLAEEQLDNLVPDLPPEELEAWQLNQTINWRGFRVDIPCIQKIVGILESESGKNLRKLDELTMGLVTKPGARKRILEFLALEGVELPDIRANTVQDALEGKKLSKVGRQLLELRKILSKTSTRKYQAFMQRAHPDDHRVRDISMYHGASTGRDSGTGVQIQNFPRPVIYIDRDRPFAPVQNIRDCDPDLLQMLYGENLSLLFSSVLRNMIIPSEGKEIFVADFSKIEVAVGWWISNNLAGIRILKMGGDPYKRLAVINSGKAYEDIEDDSLERQLAKHQILGCQYGMGWEKFQRTGKEVHRLELSETQSRAAVKQYRETFPQVPMFWRTIEKAALQAVRSAGKPVSFPHGKFICEKGYLWMILPSKRRIAYREPQISYKVNDWGEEQEMLEFWAVNSRTKKWNLERTWGGVLMENMVQGVARDLLMRPLPRLEKKGYQVLFTVHDEVVAEREIGQGTLDEFIKELCLPPAWADGNLYLEAKGFVAPRYRK